MAAPTLPAPSTPEAPEFPLLGIFAFLIVLATAVIGVMLATPSTLTLVAALATVVAFAIGVTYLLARIIGEE
jgi:uncharacterized membrane protein